MLAVQPVSVYAFNEGDGFDVYDSVGSNHGFLTGQDGYTPTWSTYYSWPEDQSPAGGSFLHFEWYPGNRVETSQPLSDVLGGSSTLSYYIRTTQYGGVYAWTSGAVTGADHDFGEDDVFWGSLDNSGGVRIASGNAAEAKSIVTVNDGVWHHVIHSRSAETGEMRTYVDGILISNSFSQPGRRNAPFSAIGAMAVVPFNMQGVSHYYQFNGDLDQIEIYDQVLTPQEIAENYGPVTAPMPTAPTGLYAEPMLNGVRLHWTPSQDVMGYVISRAGPDGVFEEIATVGRDLIVGENRYTDLHLDGGPDNSNVYTYRVRSFNRHGTSPDAATATSNPLVYGPGVTAHYFDSDFWGRGGRPVGPPDQWYAAGDAHQSKLVATNVDFTWDVRGPIPPFEEPVDGTNYSTIFTGVIRPQYSDFYQFVLNSDDDGLLWVNGELVAAAPGAHGRFDAYGQGHWLEQGQTYPFVLMHAQGVGGSGVAMKWMSATTNFIPTPFTLEELYPDTQAPNAPANLWAQADGPGVTLNFTDYAHNEWRYVVERSLNGGDFERVKVSSIVNNPFGYEGYGAIRDFVPESGWYTYRVYAENGEGRSGFQETTLYVFNESGNLPGASAYYLNSGFWGTSVRPPDYQPTVSDEADVTETLEGPINFGQFGDWVPGAGAIRPDNFSTVFTGTIKTVDPGVYTIFAVSDDDSYVYLDGTLISADPGGHGMRDPRFASFPPGRTFVNPIELQGNKEYNFVALQAEMGGGSGMIMRWVKPDGTEEVIPFEQYASNRPNARGGTTTGAPVAPGELEIIEWDRGVGYAMLGWTDHATNELRYRIERATTPSFSDAVVLDAPINATVYTDTGLEPGRDYYYRLRAENYHGASDAVTADTSDLPGDLPPPAPTNLAVRARGDGVHVAFTDASRTEEYFAIDRAPEGGTFGQIATVAGTPLGRKGDRFEHVDTTAAAGERYVYRVRAVNPNGEGVSATLSVTAGSPGGTGVTAEYFNTTNFTGQSVTVSPVDADQFFYAYNYPPDQPHPDVEPTTYSAVFRGELLAEFTQPYTFYTAGEDGLVLRIIDKGTGAVLLEGPEGGLAAQEYYPWEGGFNDTVGTVDLVAGRRYLIEWRLVQWYDSSGYRIGWSGPLLPQQVIDTELLFPIDPPTVPLYAVADVRAAALGTEAVVVQWDDANFGESEFTVQRKLAGEGDSAYATVGTAPRDATLYEDRSPLALGQEYVYRVLATRGAEHGPAGDIATVTPSLARGMTYNGLASPLPGRDGSLDSAVDNRLQLTPYQPEAWGLAGSAFTTNARSFIQTVPRIFAAPDGDPDVRGFTASFDFVYPPGYGSEGFAFVIQRVGPDALGAGSLAGGFGGLPHSFAVGFHAGYQTTYTYLNGAMFPYNQGPLQYPIWPGAGSGSRVELEYDADARTLTQRIRMLDGAGNVDPWYGEFTWVYADAATGTGYYDPGLVGPLDLEAWLGGSHGFVGFTGAAVNTGQNVWNFTFNGTPIHFTPPGYVQANTAPTARAGGPYSVVEGDSLSLDASNSSDEDGDVLTYSWDVNGDGVFGDATGVSPTLSWNQLVALGIDDGPGTFNVSVRVSDGQDASGSVASHIEVVNADPVAGPITAPSAARRINTDVSVSATFTDAGAADTHTALWDWGDGSTSTVDAIGNSVAGTHRYATPGLYTVTVTVFDDDGGSSTTSHQYLVVYDPARSASGSGWLNTPAGRATFEFDVRYKKDAAAPSGIVVFAAPGVNFRATSLDWLVVTRNGRSYLRGHGTVNGQSGYSFLLAVADGGTGRGASPDRLRMRIWSDATGDVVFDNQEGNADDAAPLAALGGGNVVLQ